MQLVERGKVDLDAPLERYLPDFHPRNPFDPPVTLRLLMSHHSGLVREPPIGSYLQLLGAAADLSLYELLQRWHRALLREAMESEGFTVYENEWWHFDYRDWRHYPIGNQPFPPATPR